jgi:hypothetical protein
MSDKRSRRGFLKGVGAGVTAGFLQEHSAAAPAQQKEKSGSMPGLPTVNHHPQPEIDLPVSRSSGKWSEVPEGLLGSFASKDEAYLRHEVPTLKDSVTHRMVAWRGERVAASIVLYTRTGANQVRFQTAPLVSRTGHKIPVESISARFVRYVLTNLPFGSHGGTCDPGDFSKAWLMPDPLDSEPRFDIGAESARPVWLSLDVPDDAKPDRYRTEVKILAEGGQELTFTLELDVLPMMLPAPREWKFQLDLWQNPWAVAWYHGVEPWSSAHIEILKPHLKMLAEAGAKFITTYLCHSPWKDDTYTADSTMVEWIRRPDGSWKFEYSIFDRYVELAMECGITRSITCYTPLPWKNRVRFLDARSGDYIWQEWPPSSQEFKSFWRVFLADLRRHLEKRGWFGKAYIGINENALEDTLAAISTVKEDTPDWKVTYAGNWHPELSDLLDDYCVIVDQPPTGEQLTARKAAGKTTTFYVCCYPARPNNYPFSPPAENTWMGWHAAALDYDGFLRWAYDSWTADPLRDARHVFWPAGDCFMVYPGARSSIRFEKLREGIADFEKIRILRSHLAARSELKGTEKLDRVLKEFTYAKVQNTSAANSVNAGKGVLEEIGS